jgi:asparagine synthase (glutamine-hydrolysing)
MCGIGGVLAFEAGGRPPEHVLRAMLHTIVHRGPDDEGVFLDDHIALGARRLSILDVPGGHQPLSNEDGTVWAALNGEIYNYKELHRDLEARGHRFRSQGDTETLVHLYEEHGDALLEHLNGMFALAIWDARQRRLLLARDRVGIKPLYYYEDAAGLVFGSEVKALLASGRVPREMDLAAVRDYTLLLYVPAPGSIIQGVRKLLPGHRLVAHGGRVEVAPYWTLPSGVETRGVSLEENVARFRDLFGDAVARHMQSDVPYGAFLSGGVDSSAIVATMSGVSRGPVKTFSIGFAGSQYYDELPYARQVATLFGTEHEAFVVEPDVFLLLEEMMQFFDEPFADAAFLPTYVLSRLSRQKVKVVLSGDGGDELFAGYDRYRSEVLAEWARRIPRLIRRGVLAPLLKLYPGPANWILSDQVRQARKKLDLLSLPPDERYVRHFHSFAPEVWSELIGEPLRALPASQVTDRYLGVFAEGRRAEFLNQRMSFDIRTWLPDQMLTKVDRATMAHGLEARVPFLDHRLVEMAMTLPDEHKFTIRTLKRFLKAAFADRLPQDILHRRKHGFQVPVDEWLRGPLRDLARTALSPAALAVHGFFAPAMVARMLDAHESRTRNWSKEIFTLLVFQMWHRTWFQRTDAAS